MRYCFRRVKVVESVWEITIEAASRERAEEIFSDIKDGRDPRGVVWNNPASADRDERGDKR